MQVQATEFPGLFIIEPRVFKDQRGFFMESWNRTRFEEAGIRVDWVQDNHARSTGAGVLRGFHYQAPPTAQAKLVWVTRGAVVDVVVDLRVGSPSYGQWGQLKLSEDNHLRLFIPKGFAHAYMTLTEETEFIYKVDAPYSPQGRGRRPLGRSGPEHQLAGSRARAFRPRPGPAPAARHRFPVRLPGVGTRPAASLGAGWSALRREAVNPGGWQSVASWAS